MKEPGRTHRSDRSCRSRAGHRAVLSVLRLSLVACGSAAEGRYVVISDNTMGSGRLGNPEDGFAILTAVLNPDRGPATVVSTFGNNDEDTAYASVLSVLEGAIGEIHNAIWEGHMNRETAWVTYAPFTDVTPPEGTYSINCLSREGRCVRWISCGHGLWFNDHCFWRDREFFAPDTCGTQHFVEGR